MSSDQAFRTLQSRRIVPNHEGWTTNSRKYIGAVSRIEHSTITLTVTNHGGWTTDSRSTIGAVSRIEHSTIMLNRDQPRRLDPGSFIHMAYIFMPAFHSHFIVHFSFHS